VGGVEFATAAPAKVDVIVSKDGRRIGGATFEPTYQTSKPNGPNCEPTCRTAPRTSLMVTF
jgi:hypothetical protein